MFYLSGETETVITEGCVLLNAWLVEPLSLYTMAAYVN